MAIKLDCPSGHRLSVDEKLRGRTVKCPKCGEKFTIPAADPQPTSTPPATPSLPKEVAKAPAQAPLPSRKQAATPPPPPPPPPPAPHRSEEPAPAESDFEESDWNAPASNSDSADNFDDDLDSTSTKGSGEFDEFDEEVDAPKLPPKKGERRKAKAAAARRREEEEEEDHQHGQSFWHRTEVLIASGLTVGTLIAGAMLVVFWPASEKAVVAARNELPPPPVSTVSKAADAPKPTAPEPPPPVQTETRVVKLPESGRAFAFNPADGTLAVAGADSGTIRLCSAAWLSNPQSGEPVQITLEPSVKLRDLAFKPLKDKTLLLVACETSGALQVFDVATRKRIAEVETPYSKLQSVDAASDPNVLLACCTGTTEREPSVSLIDLATMAVRQPLWIEGMDCRISSDGGLIYPRGPNFPSGKYAYRVLENGPSRSTSIAYVLTHEHVSIARPVPEPNGATTACGDVLHSPDFKQTVAQFDFDIHSYFPGMPLVAGIKGREVCLGSLTSYDTVGRVAVPEEMKLEPLGPARNGFPPIPADPRVLADSQLQRILIADRDQVVVMPLTKFKLPAEPLLRSTVRLPSVLYVGSELNADAQAVDPQVRCELDSGPEGLTYEAGRLKWRPASGQIGDHAILLKLSAGSHAFVQKLLLRVERPSVATREPIEWAVLNGDGTEALVMARRLERSGPSEPRPPTLAIVKVPSNEIVAERTFTEEELGQVVTSGAFDDKAVYVTTATRSDGEKEATGHVLSRKDLSIVKQFPIPVESPSLKLVGDKYLAATRMGGWAFALWTRPDLVEVSERPLIAVLESGRFDKHGPFPTGIFRDGILYDQTMTEPRLLLSAPPDEPIRKPEEFSAQVQRAGNLFSGLDGGSGRGAGVMLGRVDTNSNDLSLLGTLSIRSGDHQRIVNTVPIGTVFRFDGTHRGEGRFTFGANVAVCIVGGRLYPFRSDELAPQAPGSLCIDARQSVFAIGPEKETVIEYTVREGLAPFEATAMVGGGSGSEGYRFKALPAEGGQLKFSIDREELFDAITAPISFELLAEAQRKVREQKVSSNESVAAEKKVMREMLAEKNPRLNESYEQLTGRKPTGVVKLIKVFLNVRDSQQGVHGLSHLLYVDFPERLIREKLNLGRGS